jgi:molybdenum cofactor biosynthesis protein MoaC
VLPKHSITPDLKFQARDGEARTREMAMLEALRAASKLDQGADQDQTPEGMSKKEYEKLLQDAKRVRGKSAGYAQQKLIRMAKRADLRKKMLEEGLDVTALEVDQKVGDDGEGDDIGKLMGEISSNVPVATEHKGRLPSVGDLVEKIRDLEARIELETLIPPSEDPGSWQEYHTLPEGKAIGRETKRALWRQRRKTAARVAKAETSGMDPKQRAKLEQKHQDEVEEMRRVLAQFKGFLEEYQRSSSSGTSARDLNARRQMDAVQESKRVVRERRERILKKKIRAQWVELREKEREMDYVSTDEWAVTGKEQYLNRDMLRIFKVPESNDKPKTNVPDGLTSSIRYTNTNNPPVSQTDSNPRTTVSSQPFVQQGHVPYSKTPLSPQIPTSQTTAPQPSPTEPDVLGPSYPLAPIPPPWPEPKQQRSLSENLKPSFPADGKVIIDDELTININSPVSDMQSQLFQLQDRLKNAYPGIEILPYEVWTSKNRSVLKTWLKIMTGKWTSRFDDVNVACSVVNGAWEGDMGLGEDVKGVLDAMVRDHDLTNEAAERMGKRWLEIFRQRRKIEGDSEGRSNMEEFDAQMGWLSDSNSKRKKDAGLGGGALAGVEVASENSGKKDEEKEGDSEHKEESMLPFTWTNKPSDGFRRAGKRSFSTTVRQYLPPKVPSPSAASDQSTTPTSATTTTSTSTSTPTLPHLTSSGSAHMVSVSAKSHTVRTAIAAGSVTFSNPVPLSLIRSNALKKGDVLSVSRIAGIMAAKRTPDLIPLCHPITLTHAGVELSLFDGASTGHGGVNIEAKVECTGATGVEMEALTAVTAAALTVVDMCKAVDKGMRIQDVRVVLKEGGRSGVWKEPSWVSMNK